MRVVKGNMLSGSDKRYVLSAFIYRSTKEHKAPSYCGEYPVQFESDQDWLEHTDFYVNKDGSLDNRYNFCHSNPTWPDNPELRSKKNVNQGESSMANTMHAVKVIGYKGQEWMIEVGGYAADENGRGGKVIWITWDMQLNEYVIGAVPANGPSYELRGSMISWASPSDAQDRM